MRRIESLTIPLRAALVLAIASWRPAIAVAQVASPPAGFAVSAWTTANGLPQSAITDLELDRDGYLWVASLAGLARFDGDSFVSYPRDPIATPLKGVKSMTPDRHGTLWVAWTDGVARLDSARRLIALPSPPVVWPQLLAVASPDSVWMAFYGEVWLYAHRHWEKPPSVPFGVAGEVVAMQIDSSGALWLGGSGGLARLDAASGQIARAIPIPGCTNVGALAPASAGAMWVAGCESVFHVSPRGEVDRVELPRQPHRLSSLLVEDDGALWIGDASGVERLQVTHTATRWLAQLTFAHSLDLEGAVPIVMRAGGNGSIWVGSSGAGLRLLRRLPVARVTLANGLVDREVHSLNPDGQGGLWITGACGGLLHWRASGSQVLRPPSLGLQTPCPRGVLRDRGGNLWIGELGTLTRVTPAGRSEVILHSDANYNDIVPLLEDRAGDVWFGTSFGNLGYLTPGSERTMLPDSIMAPQKIWSMAEDSTGVWVGQVGQVTRIVDGRAVAHLDERDGMPPGPIRALAIDASGDLWIASYGGGIARYRRGHGVQRLTPGGRPFEQSMSAIVIDRVDRFWFLGDGGLVMIPRSELAAALDEGRPVRGVVELGLADGVPEGNNGFPNAWLDRAADRLWVATVDGAASVDLSRFPGDTSAPHLRIDDVRLDGVSIAATDSIVVPPDANALEIRFTAPALSGSSNMTFRYRLEGHDREWIESGSARVARYASLAPGHYTFELSGRSRGGVEQRVPLRVPVSVNPKWWETTTARIAALVATILLLWSAFQWLTRRLRARARALQHEIDVREEAERRAADAARDLAHISRLATAGELATSIAHELNQPLAAVVGSAQAAQRLLAGQDNAALERLMGVIVAQSDRAAGVIRMLRGFVTKQHTAATIVSLDAVVADTLRLLQHELIGRGVSVRVQDERKRSAVVRGDPVQLQQVLVNLLLNAAEATAGLPDSRRYVTVLLRTDDDTTVRISVIDGGDGLTAENLAKVFEPFFTTKAGGLGLGLSLSRSIIEAHSGRLWADSVQGEGSAFHILLPVSDP